MKIYSARDLPPLVLGTHGIAEPKPDATVAACRVLKPIKFITPWGKEMDLDESWHTVCFDAKNGDLYPSDDLNELYHTIKPLRPCEDIRAALVTGFWMGHGVQNPDVFLARRWVPSRVRGVLLENGRFKHGKGENDFQAGDVLVEHHKKDGVFWTVPATVFWKKYHFPQ